MNEVINKMYERKRNPYPESIAQKFVNNSEHCDTIIIVEGSSDEDFYKNTNIEILNNAYYIFAQQNENIVGKEAVIKAYFDLKEYSWRKKFNNTLIFIVDKDFFGIDWRAPHYNKIAKEKKAKDEDIYNFTILDCHSHECYFILQENLKKVFHFLNIDNKLEQFNKILDDNLEAFSEYFAYKSILEDENPRYPRFSRDWQNEKWINFNFEFSNNNIIFNIEDMKSSIEKMKNSINRSNNKDELEEQFVEMKQKFKSQPELLRGHTLFDFLECYLKHYGKDIKAYKKYNNEIIKELNIPLDIKVLKFGYGRYELES